VKLHLGRTFVGPAFDPLWIGGGATLPVAGWLLLDGRSAADLLGLSLPWLVLLVNQAHFAASTVRLYSKPGAVAAHPPWPSRCRWSWWRRSGGASRSRRSSGGISGRSR
jgi:hypothetical protein